MVSHQTKIPCYLKYECIMSILPQFKDFKNFKTNESCWWKNGKCFPRSHIANIDISHKNNFFFRVIRLHHTCQKYFNLSIFTAILPHFDIIFLNSMTSENVIIMYYVWEKCTFSIHLLKRVTFPIPCTGNTNQANKAHDTQKPHEAR